MPSLETANFKNQPVLIRADLDVPVKNGQVTDTTRLENLIPTLEKTVRSASKIIVIGHLGRPGGKPVKALKMAPVAKELYQLLSQKDQVTVAENLRFSEGEELNDQTFARQLAQKGKHFVFESFAVAHRHHASVVSLPGLLPTFLGFRFASEIKALDKVHQNPERPLVFVIGGAKVDTKAPLIDQLAKIADTILVGGKLAENLKDFISPQTMAKVKIAQLTPDGLDITKQSVKEFTNDIATAGTLIWNGPVGKFEATQSQAGTKAIAQAINQAPGYTVIGGGDTEAATTKFHSQNNINHISSGGGAMLTYLATGTLPVLEAIKQSRHQLI